MFIVLGLVMVEKIINTALKSDPISQYKLAQLSGKTLQIRFLQPEIAFNVLFNEQHIRFEPVFEAIFEPKFDEKLASIEPTATIVAHNLPDFFTKLSQNRLSQDAQNDEFLAQITDLIANFDPDIIGRLQPIIGLPLASQLTGWLEMFKTKPKPMYENIEPDERLKDLQRQLAELQKQIEIEQQKLANMQS